MAANGARKLVPVTQKFSDFRAVDGVTLPFVTTVSYPSTETQTTVQSVVYNQPLADALFAPTQDE
jgi:hypothetical protein